MHPSGAIQGRRSDRLDGKRIGLAVTGSIAAVQTVKLARELIRQGADLVPFMTRAATELIHPNSLEWATGIPPVTALTGQVEHLMGADGRLDAVLVAPATANTVAKAALAIDDTVVTSLVSTTLGNAPVLIAPAMHEQMLDNETTREHLERLRARGATIIEPFLEEREAKLAPIEHLVEHTIRALSPQPLAGQRVLVVNGSTIEDIDRMRVVTNKSTGRTGMALAREAFRLGADVEVWFGHGHCEVPDHLALKRFVTVQDLVAMAPEAQGFDLVLVPAAISDFRARPSKGKLTSDHGHTLELEPTPKVLPELRKALHDGGHLVAFKAEADVTEEALLEKVRTFRADHGALAVVANRLEDVDVDKTTVHVVTTEGAERVEGRKQAVARGVLEVLAKAMGSAG